MVKLSIIIPAYNAEPYISHLINTLKPQITPELEVIVVDDGSRTPYLPAYEWEKVITKENGGVSSARNMGLDNAKGKYVAFIDADDLVTDDFVQTILEKIDTEAPDYIYLSWETLPGGWQCRVLLKSINDEFPSFNLCVWNRVYKKALIGKTRFNEKKLIAEDAEFIRKVETKGKKKAYIDRPIYKYRSDTPDSLTKRFARGEVNTKRVVYHFQHITKDMTYLLDEVKKADKEGEVIIMTVQNDLPELSRYAMIMKPNVIKGTELRGEKTSLFQKIDLPFETQVVIYTAKTFKIGGIETWIYNYCALMSPLYDILVLYDEADGEQLQRLSRLVRVQRRGQQKIKCDTIIMNRISDPIPPEVQYKQSVQMIHAMKLSESWKIPEGRDVYITVSDAVKKSFGIGKTIHNMILQSDTKTALLLVSATRLSTFEKGAERMYKLANCIKNAKIPFIWLVFSDIKPKDPSMTWMQPTLDIKPYIAMADYLVQLSDQEGFCYSIMEALLLGTKVITTPIDVLDELIPKDSPGVIQVPFDMEDIDAQAIYERAKIEPKCPIQCKSNSIKSIEKWIEVLGEPHPKGDYEPEKQLKILVTRDYKDTELNRLVKAGEVIEVRQDRAEAIIKKGFAREEADGKI